MSSAATLYVPRDSGALAAGAERVARRIADEAAARGIKLRLVRNGSRGMFWLEPLVEVATPSGRIAYGPVAVDDVPGLFDAGFHLGAAHPLCLGLTEEIPYLKKQERLVFARMGITDPLSISDYEAHEGFAGLRRALAMTPGHIVQQVLDAGLRGRGGAAFPAGIKWKTVAGTRGEQKYVVCNADEGDSGTFSDRMTMEGDPFVLIEGMTIAGIATGATRGVEVIDRIRADQNRAQQVILLRDLCNTMVNGSLCAMGGMTPFPVLSALNHFPEDFGIAAPDRQAA